MTHMDTILAPTVRAATAQVDALAAERQAQGWDFRSISIRRNPAGGMTLNLHWRKEADE